MSMDWIMKEDDSNALLQDKIHKRKMTTYEKFKEISFMFWDGTTILSQNEVKLQRLKGKEARCCD